MSFVRSAVEPGSVVQTDGWASYNGLKDAGYRHEVTVISGSPDPAHVVMPRVHKVAALLKRWIMGTLQGGIQHQHLDYYLDEFTFRFNRRRSKSRGLLFHRLTQQAVDVEPVTLVSEESVAELARQAGRDTVDGNPVRIDVVLNDGTVRKRTPISAVETVQ